MPIKFNDLFETTEIPHSLIALSNDCIYKRGMLVLSFDKSNNVLEMASCWSDNVPIINEFKKHPKFNSFTVCYYWFDYPSFIVRKSEYEWLKLKDKYNKELQESGFLEIVKYKRKRQ